MPLDGEVDSWWSVGDRLDRLKEGHKGGLSWGAIAADLKTTRNAVVGKANRIGLRAGGKLMLSAVKERKAVVVQEAAAVEARIVETARWGESSKNRRPTDPAGVAAAYKRLQELLDGDDRVPRMELTREVVRAYLAYRKPPAKGGGQFGTLTLQLSQMKVGDEIVIEAMSVKTFSRFKHHARAILRLPLAQWTGRNEPGVLRITRLPNGTPAQRPTSVFVQDMIKLKVGESFLFRGIPTCKVPRGLPFHYKVQARKWMKNVEADWSGHLNSAGLRVTRTK